MKTLTTLTAVAALVAGISFAQAQGTMGSPSSGSSMQKSQTIGSFTVLHQHVRERRIELQICEHGGLRKRCEAAEPELFAEPEQEHHRFEVVTRCTRADHAPAPS